MTEVPTIWFTMQGTFVMKESTGNFIFCAVLAFILQTTDKKILQNLSDFFQSILSDVFCRKAVCHNFPKFIDETPGCRL